MQNLNNIHAVLCFYCFFTTCILLSLLYCRRLIEQRTSKKPNAHTQNNNHFLIPLRKKKWHNTQPIFNIQNSKGHCKRFIEAIHVEVCCQRSIPFLILWSFIKYGGSNQLTFSLGFFFLICHFLILHRM